MDSLPTSKRRQSTLTATHIVSLLVFVVLLAAVMILAISLDRGAEAESRTLAPAFELTGLDGSRVSLQDYRGLVVLLNFWATWCPPCRSEMPDLNAYQQQHRAQGFALVAINMGEDSATVRAFMAENDLHFPVLLDTNGSVYDRYGAQALPTSFIIGRDGTLIKAYPAGTIAREQLERDITPLLAN